MQFCCTFAIEFLESGTLTFCNIYQTRDAVSCKKKFAIYSVWMFVHSEMKFKARGKSASFSFSSCIIEMSRNALDLTRTMLIVLCSPVYTKKKNIARKKYYLECTHNAYRFFSNITLVVFIMSCKI